MIEYLLGPLITPVLVAIGPTLAVGLCLMCWPVAWVNRNRLTIIADYLADAYWSFTVWVIERWGRTPVVFSGDKIPLRESAIVIANHKYYADWCTVFCMATRCGRVGCCKFFAKDVIRWIPGFGWGLAILDSIFLKRDWMRDERSIRETFQRVIDHKQPFWMISHIEGTRFNPQKKKESQEFAKKHDLPVLNNVLLPRTKGFVATVQGLREAVDAVYDFTLVYEDLKTGKIEFVKGPGFASPEIMFRRGDKYRRIHINVRRYPIKDLPTNPEALAKWVVERYEEKDKLIDVLMKTKHFPGEYELPYIHRPLNIW